MFQAIARCVEPGCRCEDRRGVILYHGPSREEAESFRNQTPSGYEFAVEEA